MKVIRTNYLVWKGDNVVANEDSFEEAKKKYDKIPSGQGKAPSKRRQLVREEILIEDTR